MFCAPSAFGIPPIGHHFYAILPRRGGHLSKNGAEVVSDGMEENGALRMGKGQRPSAISSLKQMFPPGHSLKA